MKSPEIIFFMHFQLQGIIKVAKKAKKKNLPAVSGIRTHHLFQFSLEIFPDYLCVFTQKY